MTLQNKVQSYEVAPFFSTLLSCFGTRPGPSPRSAAACRQAPPEQTRPGMELAQTLSLKVDGHVIWTLIGWGKPLVFDIKIAMWDYYWFQITPSLVLRVGRL